MKKKKVKFRLVQYSQGGKVEYGIQTKKFCIWHPYMQNNGGISILSLYGNYKRCIDEIYSRQKQKKNHLTLVEYPMLNIIITN